MLTAIFMFIHTAAAAAAGWDGGAGGQQGVTAAHGRQGVVHEHVLQLGGAVVDPRFLFFRGAVVVADGATVEVQSCGTGQVRTGEGWV